MQVHIPIQEKRYIFVYVYLTLTCFSTICLVRLLSCQIGFRWAAFVKASITSHLLFLTYPSLDALTPFTSMIGKTVFHYYYTTNMQHLPTTLLSDSWLEWRVQLQTKRCSSKVKIFWEGHKNLKKNLPISQFSKKVGRFYRIFAAFSEYMNFTLSKEKLVLKYRSRFNLELKCRLPFLYPLYYLELLN